MGSCATFLCAPGLFRLTETGKRSLLRYCPLGWRQAMDLYCAPQIARGKTIECFHYEEIIGLWGDGCLTLFKHYAMHTWLLQWNITWRPIKICSFCVLMYELNLFNEIYENSMGNLTFFKSTFYDNSNLRWSSLPSIYLNLGPLYRATSSAFYYIVLFYFERGHQLIPKLPRL